MADQGGVRDPTAGVDGGKWALSLKRVLDVVGAAILLMALLPLILLSASLVMVTSTGNPLYSQIREGKGRRPIRVSKVR